MKRVSSMEDDMALPVYANTDDGEEPEEGVYYVIAENGIFLVQRTDAFESAIRINEGLPWLLPMEEKGVKLKLPKIPFELFQEGVSFLRHVFIEGGGDEAILFIFYSSTEGFKLFPPRQVVKGAGIRYEGAASPPGFQKVGDMHSHPWNSPRLPSTSTEFSVTDSRDDAQEAGLKIVVNLDQHSFSVSCSISMGGKRIHINTDDVIGNPPTGGFPDSWKRRVVRVERPMRNRRILAILRDAECGEGGDTE